MKKMKSTFAIALTVMGLQALNPTPSHAVIGLITADPLLCAMGLVAAIGADAGLFDTTFAGGPSDPGRPVAYFWGFVFLDKQGALNPSFETITPEQATAIGLSPTLTVAFNNNVDDLNQVYQRMESDMIASGVNTADRAAVTAEADKLWNTYKGSLDPLAVQAAQIVVHQNAQK
jgi:hypothetical protein